MPKNDLAYEVQLDAERRRVWIHASDGSTVGRFDARNGIDIHNTVTDQLAGKSQCLHCTHGCTTWEDWQMFREHAQKYWRIAIPADSIDPNWYNSKK